MKRYVEQGPSSERYIYHDGDYNSVMYETIRALSEWFSDAQVHEILRDIALKGSENRFSAGMRRYAYQSYLAGKMLRQGVTGLEQSANYLLSRLTGTGEGHRYDWVAGKTGVKTLEAIKNGAIVRLLVGYGAPVVPYVQKELEGPAGQEERRKEALLRVIYLID